MPYVMAMRLAESLRRRNRLAARRGWDIAIDEGGNHTKLRLNGRRTVIGRHATDLKTGRFRGILKQPDLTAADLED